MASRGGMPSVRCMRWVIYALGGGFGHLTRACALARVAPAETRVTILTNSPYANEVRRAMPGIDIVVLDARTTVEQCRREIPRRIEEINASVLVVDTFPRGLVGELVNIRQLPGRKVLVRRDVNPEYAARYELDSFIAASYDLVLAPGEGAPDVAIATAPWLIRSQNELLSRQAARVLLGLAGDRACALICAGGNEQEARWFGQVARKLTSAGVCNVRCFAPRCPEFCPAENWFSYWPAMELYQAVDVLIGGGGYNTVYESAACGVPLICRPWPRLYDRQESRARSQGAEIVMEPEHAVEAAIGAITSGRRARPQFLNGAAAASKAIGMFGHADSISTGKRC